MWEVFKKSVLCFILLRVFCFLRSVLVFILKNVLMVESYFKICLVTFVGEVFCNVWKLRSVFEKIAKPALKPIFEKYYISIYNINFEYFELSY